MTLTSAEIRTELNRYREGETLACKVKRWSPIAYWVAVGLFVGGYLPLRRSEVSRKYLVMGCTMVSLHRLARVVVRALMMPAHRLPFLRCRAKDLHATWGEGVGEAVSVTTLDGITLDGRIVRHSTSGQWLVQLHGNSGCYERKAAELREFSEQLGTNVITVNYRGVRKSGGEQWSTDDLVVDVCSVIQHLLGDGVEQKDIVIYGPSMGGGAAGEALRFFPEVHLWGDRTFLSLSGCIEGAYGRHLGTACGKTLALLGAYMGWQLHPELALQSHKGGKLFTWSSKDSVMGGQYPSGGESVEIHHDAANTHPLPIAQFTNVSTAYAKVRAMLNSQG